MTADELNPQLIKTFRRQILNWYQRHGRKDLPWQQDANPYTVWISEIMLQQTQVTTVIPYYERFMQHFPNVATLAAADLDEILHLWSGLGYYSRARNLHTAAQMIVSRYRGKFPPVLDELQKLPGVGRSTAAAILALAFEQRAAILDGNVKRVLCRYFTIEGWPTQAKLLSTLWAIADKLAPSKHIGTYTQAMMDIGALICRRSSPDCQQCPLRSGCRAHATQQQANYPQRKPKKTRPIREATLLLLQNNEQQILLEQRPAIGVWGGLWCLPQCPDHTSIETWCQQCYGLDITTITQWPPIQHSFSHFHLTITPHHALVRTSANVIKETASSLLWYNTKQPAKVGLAAPIKILLDQLNGVST